jgi:hypothetical protein
MLTRDKFPQKTEFPHELQPFYICPPKSVENFNKDHCLTCLLVDSEEIDNLKNGVFSNYTGKRPDQIHYSIGIGLIEYKSTNFSVTDIKEKLSQFKRYFENKYLDNKLCNVKYCVLLAYKLSDKVRRELEINNKNNLLVYKHSKKKTPFTIGNVPVYFYKIDR